MRGYFSFLLVFLAVLSFFYLSLSIVELSGYSQAKSVVIESLYYNEMNLKETAREIARQAGQEAFLLYLAEVAASGDPASFSIREAERRIRDGVHQRLMVFDSYLHSKDAMGKGVAVSFWCSNSISSTELIETKKAMLEQKNATACSACSQVATQQCHDLVDVDVSITTNPPSISTTLVTVDLSRFGFSLYSKKYGVAAVGYFPPGSEVVIE